MRGWFRPYRALNLACIVFLGLRILMHMVWLNAWVNYTMITVASLVISTQILRNVWQSEQRRPLTLTYLSDSSTKKLTKLHIRAQTVTQDIFNSLGNNTRQPHACDMLVTFRNIAWVYRNAHSMATEIHLSDGSHIAGTLSKKDYELLVERIY